MKSQILIFSFIAILIFYLSCFVPVFYTNSNLYFDNITINSISLIATSSEFIWPSPGYTTITSYFGYRKSPFTGKPSYHSGVDIGAPVGSKVVSCVSGEVVYAGFNGAGGYTVIIENLNYKISYCHLSPIFLVSVGSYVPKGSVIGKVGPKNVYGELNNPYRDSSGNPTNGSTTGPHLHITIKKDGKAVNPLDYLSCK